MVHVLKEIIVLGLNVIICFKEYSCPIYNYILDLLLEGLKKLPTFKQIILLEIELKRITSDFFQGHIIQELRICRCFSNSIGSSVTSCWFSPFIGSKVEGIENNTSSYCTYIWLHG